jgi:hypothetical protein
MSHTVHPDLLKRREVAASANEWDYWPPAVVPHAVLFAIEVIKLHPTLTPEQMQQVLTDTYTTTEKWIRADAKP